MIDDGMTRSRSARHEGGADRDEPLGRPAASVGSKLPELPFIFVGIAAVVIVVSVILEVEAQDIGGKLVVGLIAFVLLSFVMGAARAGNQPAPTSQNSPRMPKPKRGAPEVVQGSVTRSGA